MRIAFVLSTPDLNPSEVQRVAASIAVQLHRDLCPAWSLERPEVDVRPYSSIEQVSEGVFPVVLLRDSDQANALGYHSETIFGKAYAKVFTAGLSFDAITEVISHECCEVVPDQHCNTYELASDGRFYAREVCDPVEGQTYNIDGVEVANFVLPLWYNPILSPHDNPKVDFMGLLPGPLTKTSRGYTIVEDRAGFLVTEPETIACRFDKCHPASRTARRLSRPRTA